MSKPFKGIDHVMVVVPDIEAAGRTYGRLGFDVQPLGVHSHLGTANHLAIFENNYLELLGIVTPGPLNESYGRLAAEGGALANIALQTDGADLAHAAWTSAGLNPEPILAFDRAVEVAGKTERAAFRVVRLPHQARPGVGLFVCEHLTPQFVYRPEWRNHANGVTGLTGVTIVAADPLAYEAAAVRVFGRELVRREGTGMSVALGTAPISYLDPAAFARRFPGTTPGRKGDHAAVVGLKVRDRDALVRILAKNEVPARQTPDGRVLVDAAFACNIILEFSI